MYSENGCIITTKVLKCFRRTWRHREVLQFLQIALFSETMRLGQRSFDSHTQAFTYSYVSLGSSIDCSETSSCCAAMNKSSWVASAKNFVISFLFFSDSPNSFLLNIVHIYYRIFDGRRAQSVLLLNHSSVLTICCSIK